MKYNTHKIFDLLCTEIYYGLNFKITMMGLDNRDLDTLCGFINKCREGRKLATLDYHEFLEAPELKLSWNEWNSGGGCMIWSHDFCDGTSVHVTDECLVLSKFNSNQHWDAEFDPDSDEEDYITMTHHFTDDHEEPLSFYLCPFLGQEMADLVAADVNEIHRCW